MLISMTCSSNSCDVLVPRGAYIIIQFISIHAESIYDNSTANIWSQITQITLEVVGRGSETQLQVVEHLNKITQRVKG